ncbi:hypothetical protein V5O48_002785 [Marasmius crinis-equi]|uniref:Histone chaperone RTT106/FACT complex subunit SPT16-like middle domain-containing protein n=1 Tax=Marasmius crinis-equi TaxID=585013 RepID=A0ABR3FUT6_9AGAR
MDVDPKTPFLDAVSSSLPDTLSKDFQSLYDTSNNAQLLDNFIRFICGGPCGSQLPNDQEQWIAKQSIVRNRLSTLAFPSGPQKRARETNEPANTDHNGNKRQKSDTHEPSFEDDPPLFTLKSISATSPVRKRVDITIHKSSIRFHNATTNALEHSAPISSLRRGFLVPTRGKTKPHWTVILISNDVPELENRKVQASAQGNFQVIFGVDASATSAMTTLDHTVTPTKETSIKKGEETLPLLRSLFSHLPIRVIEPSPNVFKSAFPGAGGNGVPGVEAYRGAKAGSLWFMKEGILWGDAKPCEFWPVEDLVNKTEGLRIISATGRTLTVILMRRGEQLEDGEVVREETQFAPIDAKEQDGINQWVRQHRHLFGLREGNKEAGIAPPSPPKTTAGTEAVPAKPFTLSQAQFDSDDEEDEDFAASSDDESGSGSSSDEDGDGGSGGREGDDDDDADGDDDEEEEGEEEELKPENHPSLRPGAMPKMSRAAIDMVVDMVEGDLAHTVAAREESDAEEDELDD